MLIDTINKDLKKSGLDITINDNEYTIMGESRSQTFINGKRVENREMMKLKYVGDGSIKTTGDDENVEEICGFDVLDKNGEMVTTLYVSSADELISWLN